MAGLLEKLAGPADEEAGEDYESEGSDMSPKAKKRRAMRRMMDAFAEDDEDEATEAFADAYDACVALKREGKREED